MRFLFFGDAQIGAGGSLGVSPHGEGSRLADQQRMLYEIADVAVRERVDAVVFGGDLFERRNPTVAEILVAQEFVRQVTRFCDFVAIAGNHDVQALSLPSALDLFKGDPSVTVAGDPYIYNAGGETSLCLLPWTPLSKLVSELQGGERDLVYDTATRMLVDEAREMAREASGARKVLVAHWAVSGATLPNGIKVDDLGEVVLPLDELAAEYDTVCLAHIHQPQTLGPYSVFYSGSPWVCNWGEAGFEHGVHIVDGDELRFVPISDRRFVTVEADLTTGRHVEMGLSETDALAAAAAVNAPLDGAVVRYRVTATEEQARRVDWSAIREALAQAGVHKVTGAATTLVRDQRARVEGLDETAEPMKAVDLYLDRQEIEEKLAAEMRDRATTHLERIR